MKKTTFTLMFLALAFLSACTGNIKGKVFLDLDGDNVKDDGESPIANMTFSVTKDDEDFKTGTTDENGEFEFEQDGAGTYCITIDEDDLLNAEEAVLITPSMASTSPTFTRSTSPSFTSETIATPLAASTSDEEDTSTDEDTTDTTDSTDSSDSTTVESGYVCIDSTGFDEEADVPIAIVYDVTSSDTVDEDLSRGDTITLELQFPVSCTFDAFILPSSVVPTDPDLSGYNSVTKTMNLNTAVSDNTTLFSTSDPGIINYDTVGLYEFELEAQIDELDEETVTLDDITMTCPDDSTITLPTITLNLTSEDIIEISQEITDGTPANDTALEITTTISNSSDIDFTSDDVELTITITGAVTGQTYTPDVLCDHLGNSAVCNFDLDSGDFQDIVSSFTIHVGSATETTEYSIDATLVIDGTTFIAPSVSFFISPP